MEVQILADTGKMIKLKSIINEIKVNKPLNITDKKTLLDWWWENGNYHLLSYITHSSSLNGLINDWGYDNLEDFLADEFNFEGDEANLYKNYIESYYRMFKPKEILVSFFGDGNGADTKGTSYKNIEIIYMGDRNYVLYCNNF